ncbi:hypothetical protein H4219_003206 [Mycoemilia scoparia]|uniref:GH16 domain-containing protein n=1 Tax=Mycoemilia scoparia TaxID=417184 RepID=A0A9W7ZVH3_9FUNG|nr:hypothetical protein H4219_003206 [Mycoemilia scoparia]
MHFTSVTSNIAIYTISASILGGYTVFGAKCPVPSPPDASSGPVVPGSSLPEYSVIPIPSEPSIPSTPSGPPVPDYSVISLPTDPSVPPTPPSPTDSSAPTDPTIPPTPPTPTDSSASTGSSSPSNTPDEPESSEPTDPVSQPSSIPPTSPTPTPSKDTSSESSITPTDSESSSTPTQSPSDDGLPKEQPPQDRKLCYDQSRVFKFDSPEDLNKFGIEQDTSSFSVSDGKLRIAMDQNRRSPTIVYPEYLGAGGKWDMNLKMAPSSGVVTAFVMYGPGQPSQTDEIDFEWVGRDPSNVQTMFFVNGKRVPGNEGSVNLGSSPAQDLSATFHTYSIEYNKDYVNWYMDGAVRRTITNKKNGQFPADIGKLRFGVWDGSNTSGWAGTVNFSKGPFVAEIDWIRYTPYC